MRTYRLELKDFVLFLHKGWLLLTHFSQKSGCFRKGRAFGMDVTPKSVLWLSQLTEYFAPTSNPASAAT
jgi:hypothetical protein